MKILVTEIESLMGQLAARQLAIEHEVTTCSPQVDLRDPLQVEPLLTGVEAVVHTALTEQVLHRLPLDADRLDWATRGSYVLLNGCQQAGVERAILLSSLACFQDYPPKTIIDETWQPLPRPEAAALAPVLAERTFREFARQGPLITICLRFGPINALEGTPDELGIRAIQQAVTMPITPGGYRWWLFHVVNNRRFPMRAAASAPLSLQEANEWQA